MRYNVAQLLKESIGSTRNYRLDESFTGPQNQEDTVCGPVHLLRTHRSILVSASLQVQSAVVCARCLKEFVRSSVLSVEEEFFPTAELQTGRGKVSSAFPEEGSYLDDSHTLDLASIISECIIADMPIKPLCWHDCAGLCRTCGANLNLATCDCNSPPADPRWQALAGLVRDHDG